VAAAPPSYISTRPYTILINMYDQRQEAHRIALALREKGDLAFTSQARIWSLGDQYRVFIGLYKNRKEADRAAQKLRGRNFRQVKVVRKPYGIQLGQFRDEYLLKAMENDLLAKGFIGYRIAYREDATRLMIGAYDTQRVPASLLEELRSHGYSPLVVLR
jgi:cell division protein FtsN